MNELKCPKCNTTFKIDEGDYAFILNQVRDNEFNKQINSRIEELNKQKEDAVKLTKIELDKKLSEELSKKDKQIDELKYEIKTQKDKTNNEIENIKVKTETNYKDEINKLKLNISELEGTN